MGIKMPLGKRKFSSVKRSRVPYAKRAKRARYMGRTGYAGILRASVATRVNNLYRMIETKECQYYTASNVSIAHNNLVKLTKNGGGDMNIFETAQAVGDPQSGNSGNRLGDRITVKGVSIKIMLENALERPEVHYRIMLLRGAKGETFDRANIFKGSSINKLLDQVNTERFTIMAQKTVKIRSSNYTASTVSLTGVGYAAPNVAGDYPAGHGTKLVKMWIPGVKFGKGGNVQFENGSTTQVKFYDYRIIVYAYEWYGTPESNNVGKINECVCRTYYKDA